MILYSLWYSRSSLFFSRFNPGACAYFFVFYDWSAIRGYRCRKKIMPQHTGQYVIAFLLLLEYLDCFCHLFRVSETVCGPGLCSWVSPGAVLKLPDHMIWSVDHAFVPVHESFNCALKVCSVYSLVAYVDLIGFFEHQIVFVLTKQTGLGPAWFLAVKGLYTIFWISGCLAFMILTAQKASWSNPCAPPEIKFV